MAPFTMTMPADAPSVLTLFEASEYREANGRALWGANSDTFAAIREDETAYRQTLINSLPEGHPYRATLVA